MLRRGVSWLPPTSTPLCAPPPQVLRPGAALRSLLVLECREGATAGGRHLLLSRKAAMAAAAGALPITFDQVSCCLPL